MLEAPALAHERIAASIQQQYGLRAAQITFLPLGADVNTAVYRVVADDGRPYFLKLRRGEFDRLSVALASWLAEQGIAAIIAPIATGAGRLWGAVDDFTSLLYPFVEGRNGYEVGLSDEQWRAFGRALRRIHDADLPPELRGGLQREAYTPMWRERALFYLQHATTAAFEEPVAARMLQALRDQRAEIAGLVERAERLASILRARPRSDVVCHTDLHAGNFLISDSGALYIVDWDAPILAPRERDLMYVGGSLMGGWRTPHDEERLFYQGYGAATPDPVGLAYYRYERIVQDIAAYCDQLLLSMDGGEDREQSFQYFMSNFGPRGMIAQARAADTTAPSVT